jgi:hypothetical protein
VHSETQLARLRIPTTPVLSFQMYATCRFRGHPFLANSKCTFNGQYFFIFRSSENIHVKGRDKNLMLIDMLVIQYKDC